jgi:hypothetical protein
MSETTITTADEIGLAKLRAEVPAHLIAKLPRVTCRDCSNNKGSCASHKKTQCPVCKSFISPQHIHLDYVGHAETTSILLDADPGWFWEPMALGEDGLPKFDDTKGLWIRLTVCGVTRIGYGTAENAFGNKARGDLVKEVIGDAIRNAAMRFGVALDLWAKSDLHRDEHDEPGAQVAEAVERKAKRERRTKPPEDDPFAAKPADRPSDSVLRNMAIGLKDRGFATDEERHAEISRIVGRPITSAKQLSDAEARHVMRSIAGTKENPAPNPRNGDTGKPLDPAAFVPSLQILLSHARGENGPSVAASLDGLIAKASTAPELAAIWRVADEAHKGGHISRDEFANLNLLGQAKDRELSGQAPAQPQHPDAPSEAQLAKASHFANQIKDATSPEELGAIYNTIVEARDVGQVTALQVGALEAQLDARYEAMAKSLAGAPEPSGGWSHQRFEQMTGASL